MSCNHNSTQCICKTLKEIAKAQSLTNEVHQIHCQNLNSPLEMGANFNTIPIMLICQSTCDFFIGSGVFESNEAFECFKTPVFRVSKVIEEHDDQCCVELELLQPHCETWSNPSYHDHDVCSFFSGKKVKKFIRTGICLRVDVSCFCGIECLPAVKAHHEKPVSPPPHKKVKIFQEEICGNFGPGTQTVWEAISVDNIQGTFQIFNSAQSTSSVEGFVEASKPIIFPTVPPGSTITRSTTFPTSFTINAPKGTNGKYCIILTKLIPVNPHHMGCE
ncbi:hypothetical protein AXI59_16250 [Bacillus nakamurai]|uniref:Endospore appendages core domain-containing protein n=1 Tax=Bacillus nakamurai TaxID=1793963 RepID=A0A150F1Y5_9BACI|nr:CotY/CotZ family spore coat protein [Bacillus nakamurai]KXZ12713.1 hypothetical protein AXI58_06260 [Bacillus nakamurai]KXZ18809.1 hypothetical protein AXI59_16250 [Bacillus nakamurai]MED1228204.1 CotY/CotZ family spore coat protein [Bacillus nakamurai]